MMEEHHRIQQEASCRYVAHSWPVEDTSTERRRDSAEPVLFDIAQEKVVLVGKPFVVAANFLNDAVGTHTKRALGIVVAQTSIQPAKPENSKPRQNRGRRGA
jgi:hypothetical protein